MTPEVKSCVRSVCTQANPQPLTAFSGHKNTCRACVATQKAAYYVADLELNRARGRAANRKRRALYPLLSREAQRKNFYQMTPGRFWAMLRAQGDRCYLCERPLTEPEATVDHDHRCCPLNAACPGCWRGIVHARCNLFAGMLESASGELDSLAVFQGMARNLEAARIRVEPTLRPDAPKTRDKMAWLVASGHRSPGRRGAPSAAENAAWNRFRRAAGAAGRQTPPSQNPEIPSASGRGERQARDARPREATSGEQVPQ